MNRPQSRPRSRLKYALIAVAVCTLAVVTFLFDKYLNPAGPAARGPDPREAFARADAPLPPPVVPPAPVVKAPTPPPEPVTKAMVSTAAPAPTGRPTAPTPAVAPPPPTPVTAEQLLRQTLAPTWPPVALPASTSQRWPVDAPVRSTLQRAALPPAELGPAVAPPAPLHTAAASLLPSSPAVDVPPLASAQDVTPPANSPAERPLLAIAPAVRVDLPDPGRTPIVSTLFAPRLCPPDDKPATSDDPTVEESRQLARQAQPAARAAAAPYEKISVPDPFEALLDAELRSAPSDADAPVSYGGVPARPALPAK